MQSSIKTGAPLDELAKRFGGPIFIAGILFVIWATLYPIGAKFYLGKFSFSRFATELTFSSDLIVDLTINVVLFMPFGFGLACLLSRRKWRTAASTVTTVLAGGGLSLTVEIAQIWLPSRQPALNDVLMNSSGAWLGLVCFRRCGIPILDLTARLAAKFNTHLSFGTVMVGFVGYTVVALLVSLSLLRGVRLSGWEPTFPLILGNELTGQRPWHGTLSELHIANRAVTKTEAARLFALEAPSAVLGEGLVASYELTGGGDYHDQTGNLAALTWRGPPPNALDALGVPLSSEHWLVTTEPASILAQKLVESSQFTLITTVTSAGSQQWESRIVSMSKDLSNRNFTLGQNARDLFLRFRTPVTGPNAMTPLLIVPEIFAETMPHRLVISYDAVGVQIYIDGLERSYSVALTPEVTFFHYLLGTWWWRLYPHSSSVMAYTLLYYGFVFIPTGWLLALAVVRAKEPSRWQQLSIWAGVLLPPVTLEIILAHSRSHRPHYMILGMVVTATTLLLCRAWMTRRHGCRSCI